MPNPSPTNRIAVAPAAVMRGSESDRYGLLPHHPATLAATTTLIVTTAMPVIDHRIPAAVTAQLVSAAGTRRRSRRPSRPPTGMLTHGPGHAASPAVPDRYRRPRRAGRRW